MDLARLVRHLCTTDRRLERLFPPVTLAAIERAIALGEASHDGEIRFAVEAALDAAQLIRGQTARSRALDLFGQMRVWDTENNNGVLVYLLLADRAVEIVADRGIDRRVDASVWRRICGDMEARLHASDYSAAVIDGLQALNRELAAHFPSRPSNPDELSNRAWVVGNAA